MQILDSDILAATLHFGQRTEKIGLSEKMRSALQVHPKALIFLQRTTEEERPENGLEKFHDLDTRIMGTKKLTQSS